MHLTGWGIKALADDLAGVGQSFLWTHWPNTDPVSVERSRRQATVN